MKAMNQLITYLRSVELLVLWLLKFLVLQKNFTIQSVIFLALELYFICCKLFHVFILMNFRLTGQNPFEGEDFLEILQNNKDCKFSFDEVKLRKIHIEGLFDMKFK